ncbi:MAG: antibiotic biosynthesis monooxygenase [Alphaproteobacteria bacterium 64-11]|nr:antibiotic biosynthesis monooxygenase [Alphaproteobacteria bacterium]OJU13614.1 MAG: antibiotic biosynthesis monooxygenase [Alphaproteobacteria bacterium 64-11]
MILERAIFAIKLGQADEFEKAFALAAPLIRAAKGCRKANMHRGIENSDSFILLVEWDTLEDHMVGFRESRAFEEWRAILGPHFASPPAVEHYTAPL